MEYRVDVCETVPQTTLRLPWELRPDRFGEDVAAGMHELTAAVDRAGLIACGAPTITYQEDTEPGRIIEIDIGVPVDLGTKLGIKSGAEVIAQPGGRVARICHRGGYGGLDTAYQALHGWLRESGCRSIGPPTEVYLVGPDETNDPRQLITDIRIPIAAAPVMAAHVDGSFRDAVRSTREALVRQGFEVVAETDVQALIHASLDEHIDNRLVLSAYHPLLTARALAADPHTAWLSPTIVVVRAGDTGTVVEVPDPAVLWQVFDGTTPPELAEQFRRLLADALDTLHAPRWRTASS